MAYQTGSGSTSQSLLNALAAFATSQGWTVAAPSVGNLKLSNGIVHATINTSSRQLYIFTGTLSTGSLNLTTDVYLDGGLSVGFNDLDPFWRNQSSSCGQGQGYCPGIRVYDLNNIVGWFFFSGNTSAGDPPYIHVVVQTASDRFAHFSMGKVDPRGLSHSGVAYCTSGNPIWQQDQYLDNGASFALPSRHGYAFVGGYPSNSGFMNLLDVDAFPTSGNWTKPIARNGPDTTQPVFLMQGGDEQFAPYRNRDCALCENISMSSPSTYAGFNILWALPALAINTSIPAIVYVGDFPNVRGCNMEGLNPAEEITLVNEVWKIFPMLRQSAWVNSGRDVECSSGQYALAYKKIV